MLLTVENFADRFAEGLRGVRGGSGGSEVRTTTVIGGAFNEQLATAK